MSITNYPNILGGEPWAQKRLLLPALMAFCLHGGTAYAQEDCVEMEGTPPGLYATTDEGRTFLIKDGEMVELAPGQSGYANKDQLYCIKAPPKFLDWPCSTDAAKGRKFATYALSEISGDPGNIINDVVRRYFEVPEVIEPIPNWIDGESHTSLSANDIIAYSAPEFWYRVSTPEALLDPKRPRTLLISLYVGINQVVIDNQLIDVYRNEYAGQPIPVVFVFNDSNVVPVSYFGTNVSLEEIFKAFVERRIKLAEVPLWPVGDYHFSPTAKEFEVLVELPDFDDIDPYRREALAAELQTFGFAKKPIFVTMLDGGGKLYVDDPDRVRVAIDLGIERLNTVVNFVEQDDHLRRCGPGTPVGSSGVSGATTPIGGANPPPGGVIPPPPPTTSDS